MEQADLRELVAELENKEQTIRELYQQADVTTRLTTTVEGILYSEIQALKETVVQQTTQVSEEIDRQSMRLQELSTALSTEQADLRELGAELENKEQTIRGLHEQTDQTTRTGGILRSEIQALKETISSLEEEIEPERVKPDIPVVVFEDKSTSATESNEPISTAVLYCPEDLAGISVKSEIQLEDIKSLEAELPDGGAASSVHSPHSTVIMQTHGLGGPIAAMLSPETEALVIFGSILDDWVLAEGKLLSDASNFIPKMVKGRKKIGSWDTSDSSEDVEDSATPNTEMFEDAMEVFEDALDSESRGDAESTDSSSTDSDPEDLDLGTGVFCLRGGASTSDVRYSPWLSPVHNLDIHLTIQTSSGVPHNVKILSKIQFTTQSKYLDPERLGYRYQIISRTELSVVPKTKTILPDRSHSSVGFLVHGQYISRCEEMPAQVQVGKLVLQEALVKTWQLRIKMIEYMRQIKNWSCCSHPFSQITPKWIVECEPGHEFKNNDDCYEELNFSYMSTSSKPHEQHPLKVEFSAGINVGDLNNTRNTDLPPVAFITRNQTMLWLPNGSLKSKGIGIIVLTSAYISEIQTIDELYLLEYQTVQLNRDSIITYYLYKTEVPPTDRALPSQPGNPLALAIGVLPDTAEPGFLKQILNRVTKSLKVQREGPLAANIETLPQHEFTSQGWDATRNEWRMPIYPSLSHCLRQAVKNSTLRTWNLKVVGLEPDIVTKGKQRDPDKDVNTALEEPKAALPFVGNSDKVDIVHDEFGKLWLDLDGKVMCARNCKGIHLRLSSNAMFKPKSRLEPLADCIHYPHGIATPWVSHSPQNKRLSTSALFFILGGLLEVA
ncbi:hypothetical protein B0H16DRAFT_1788080 [Mycena metata]|uniref:Uncharacterized protein n=1 Tax=Mycena metata TaxID=1033252 RepID=A0AAD7HL68_9AGAR|nr:hypothetical protein B0H16DRAFT_1788080 [Mycena metata]